MAKKSASKLPKAVQQFFASAGRKGGKATGPTKARDSEKMSAAARKRWEKHREQQDAQQSED